MENNAPDLAKRPSAKLSGSAFPKSGLSNDPSNMTGVWKSVADWKTVSDRKKNGSKMSEKYLELIKL